MRILNTEKYNLPLPEYDTTFYAKYIKFKDGPCIEYLPIVQWFNTS